MASKFLYIKLAPQKGGNEPKWNVYILGLARPRPFVQLADAQQYARTHGASGEWEKEVWPNPKPDKPPVTYYVERKAENVEA